MEPPVSWGIDAHVRMLVLLVALVLAAVGVHYEVLRLTTTTIRRVHVRPRLRVAFGVLGGLVAHVIEILVFAVGYGIAMAVELGGIRTFETGVVVHQLGSLDLAHPGVRDVIYFSVVTYTSLGYGDIVPFGPLRLIAGFETLTGLVLIAWTASFTYIQMERFWSDT